MWEGIMGPPSNNMAFWRIVGNKTISPGGANNKNNKAI
jgi:hypothetical protein